MRVIVLAIQIDGKEALRVPGGNDGCGRRSLTPGPPASILPSGTPQASPGPCPPWAPLGARAGVPYVRVLLPVPPPVRRLHTIGASPSVPLVADPVRGARPLLIVLVCIAALASFCICCTCITCTCLLPAHIRFCSQWEYSSSCFVQISSARRRSFTLGHPAKAGTDFLRSCRRTTSVIS